MSLDLMEIYTQCSATLNDIDEKLDSRDPGTGSVKTKVINDWVSKTESNWSAIVTRIIEQLNDADEETQIGFYYGFQRAFEKQYHKKATELVDKVVENTPKQAPLITEDEVPALTEIRKDVYAKIKSIMAMAEAFGDDESLAQMTPPRRRGGAPKGKRGPRAINLLSWSIEGVSFANLKEVVEVLPFYDKVKELTDAMKAAKIDTTNPPAEIQFELPDGRFLVGVNDNADDDEDDDDDDSEETTSDEE